MSPCHCVHTPTVNSHTQIEPLYGLPRVVDILSSSPRKICCAHRPGQVGGLSARVVVCHPPRLMPPLPDNNNNNKGKEGGRTRRFFSIHRNPWNVYNTRRERKRERLSVPAVLLRFYRIHTAHTLIVCLPFILLLHPTFSFSERRRSFRSIRTS